jgi:hypothetical protein
MMDVESGTGVSRARPEQVLGVTAAQIGLQNLRAQTAEFPRAEDKIYASNQALWQALIGERLRATAVVKLEDFWLSEWFPLRPGLFHTPKGYENRSRANGHRLTGPGVSNEALQRFQYIFGPVAPQILERFQLRSSLVYDPYGKSFMLDGGVGCVRLKCKQIPEGRAWFMGASSSPIAHEGVPVALPNELYAKFIERITEKGFLRCSIIGKLAQIPDDFDPLYRDLIGIPQLYILADKLLPSESAGDTAFLSTGAVLIEARPSARAPEAPRHLGAGIYGAYVSFCPGKPNAIGTAVEWLEDIYVRQLLNGRVLTDFDEQVRRFSGTVFSLEQVMNGDISKTDAEHLLVHSRAPLHEIHQVIEKIEIVNGDAWNIVSTQGQTAVAGHSSARPSAVRRAKESRWARVFAGIALAATATATILLALKVTDIGIASYILAIIAIVVGVVPQLSK